MQFSFAMLTFNLLNKKKEDEKQTITCIFKRYICCSDATNKTRQEHGYPALEYIDNGMGHGLMHVCKTCICPTDFGVAGNLTTNQVNEYLAARAAFFFQSILNFQAKNLAAPSLFVSCEDYRHSTGACATAADNNSCP